MPCKSIIIMMMTIIIITNNYYYLQIEKHKKSYSYSILCHKLIINNK